jgi:hypothetical protein
MKSIRLSQVALAAIAALAALSFNAQAGPRNGGCGCGGDPACIEARREAAPCPRGDANAPCPMQGRGMMYGAGGHQHGGGCAGPRGANGCPFTEGDAKPALPPAPPKAN